MWQYGYMTLTGLDSLARNYLNGVTGPEDGRTEAQISAYNYFGNPSNGDTPEFSRHRFGMMKSMANVNTGGVTTFNYLPNGRAFKISDPDSTPEQPHVDYIAYDLSNRRTTYTNAKGDNTVYVFNPLGQTTRTINPDGTRRDQTWDIDTDVNVTWDDQLMTSATNEVGHTVNYQYYTADGADGLKGNLLSQSEVVDAGGRVLSTAYKYGPHNQAKEVRTSGTGQIDRVTLSGFDAAGNVETVTQAVDPGSITTKFVYRPDGLVERVTSPRGYGVGGDLFDTVYTYNPAGQVLTETRKYKVSQTTAHDVVTEYRYNDQGNVLETIDPTSRSVKHDYDLYGRPLYTHIDDPDGPTGPLQDQITRNVYHDGRLAYTQDPRGEIDDPALYRTHFAYDKNGRVTQVTNPDGSTTHTEYDQLGNPIRGTDERDRVTQTFYDSRNRPVQTLYEDGGFTRTRYDGAGRVVSTAEPMNHVTPYGLDPVFSSHTKYDEGGRAVFVQGPVPGPNEADADAESEITTFGYYPFGEVSEEHYYFSPEQYYALGDEWRSTYITRDRLGRATVTRSSTGLFAETIYDKNGNAEFQRTYDASTVAEADVVTVPLTSLPMRQTQVYFDTLDRPEAVVDPAGNISRTGYDLAGRVIRVQDPRGELTPADEHDFLSATEYDGAGRVWRVYTPKVEFINPDTGAVGVEYHPFTVQTYDQAGNPLTFTDARGAPTTTLHDNRNRLTQTINADSYSSYTSYYTTGEVETKTDELSRQTRFNYDGRGRLIETILPDPDNGSARDQADQRLRRRRKPHPEHRRDRCRDLDALRREAPRAGRRGWACAGSTIPWSATTPTRRALLGEHHPARSQDAPRATGCRSKGRSGRRTTISSRSRSWTPTCSGTRWPATPRASRTATRSCTCRRSTTSTSTTIWSITRTRAGTGPSSSSTTPAARCASASTARSGARPTRRSSRTTGTTVTAT